MLRASLLLAACLSCAAAGLAQTPTPSNDPLAELNFLTGTWSAKTDAAAGSSGAQALGTYTFARDLNGHALVRTSSADSCKGPANFDCQHHDQLTIFADTNGQAEHHAAIFALYLDSEGHVIYYAVSTPDAHTAVFNSQGPATIPKFRLVYRLEGDGPKAVMSGKFQMAAPGSSDFHSYLEWSGTKQ